MQQHPRQALARLHMALSSIPDGHIHSDITCLNYSSFSAVFACKRANSRVILKLFYGPEKAKIVQRLQRELENVSAHMGRASFGVNPCLAIYPPQGLAVLGFIPGKTLAAHLDEAPPAARHRLIAASGGWLHSYIGNRKRIKTFPIAKWKAKIETTILPQMQTEKRFLCEQLLDVLAAQLPRLEGAPTVFAASHGDFVAKNLILNGDAIYGVDIHCKTVMPLAHELARFLVWLHSEQRQPAQPLIHGLFADDLQALTSSFQEVLRQNKHIFTFFTGYQIFRRMVNMRGNTDVYTRASLMMADYLANDPAG